MAARRNSGLTTPRRAHLLALEPRMMFDAALAATTEAVLTRSHAVEARDHLADATAAPAHGAQAAPTAAGAAHRTVADGPAASAPAATPAAGHEIIFIDTAVSNYQQLAAEWSARGEVVLINDQSDGLAQVEAVLATETGVSAIHIVSHGEEGAFYLGTTRVDQAAITGSLAGELAQIGRSLEPGGDILIYGCDFAEGSDGAAALHAFATATGADVAASTDLTGAAARGGDWTLEAHDGAIQTRTLSSSDYGYVLVANTPVPIAVTANSLTVTDAAGNVVVSHTTAADGTTTSTGYGSDARSPDLTAAGATAVWANAATYQGQALDLKATVLSLSTGDAVRFNAPGGTSQEADDATFLLRDLTNNGTDATISIKWELVLHGTNTDAPADVEFTIGDIDGIGNAPNATSTAPTRESVSTSTDNLAYYTSETGSDIYFTSSLAQITAAGTKNENSDTTQPEDTKSNATFDYTNVSSFVLNYRLTSNSTATQAQFYQDGNATLKYTAPVYVSIPRLDLDADNSTQGYSSTPSNDAHFTYTADGAATPVVDSDVRVSNPMDINSIVGASVVLTNAKAGDVLTVGTLPSNITDTISTANGQITVTLSGNGSEADYQAALKAIGFSNTLATNPDTTQRVIDVSFANAQLTSAIAVSRIDINHAPTATGTLADQSTQDAATVRYATAGSFTDVDGDALSYSATGLPAGLAIDAGTGVISGTLGHSDSQPNGGAYTVVVTATDPSNASATQAFHIAVTNPAPVAVDDSATTLEDTSVAIAVLANDHDPDGDTLTVTGASALHGSVVVNADQTLGYTPDALYSGADTISYAITDGEGGVAQAAVAVTIAHVNHAPTATGTLADQSTQDAATVRYATAGSFTDVDGDALTYTATGLPAGLTIDAGTGAISGTLGHSDSQPNGGAYTVVVTATDPSNASATQAFHIAVTNPAPVAVDDRATTLEDTSVAIAVLANDHDPDGDTLTVTGATALHGSVVVNADQTLGYTPDALYSGADTISYAITDGEGGVAQATVAVTIAHVNHAPTATGTLADQSTQDAATVHYATAGSFTDVDGDALTYSATGLPAGLAIDAGTGVISGTLGHSDSQPNGGAYTVVVTATDPSNASATQAFHIAVTNPAPVAVDDSATTHVDTPVDIAVLANDHDPDGDPLSVTAATAAHGRVSINPDGTLHYVPDAGFAGSDAIAYTIVDGDGATAHATVTVAVTNVAPVAEPIADQSALDGQTVALPLGARFSDADGDTLRFTATGLPAGLSIDAATGLISGTIDHAASQVAGGVYTTIVTADDGHGGTTATNLHWTIANPAPIARNDRATTAEDTALIVAPLANDTDPDGDALVIESASAPNGRVAINPDGTLSYTPNAGFSGQDAIAYTISDGEGGRSSATVMITITPDPPSAMPLAARSDHDNGEVALPTAQAFSDPGGERLTFSATGLPPGLAIDPATGLISGTLTDGDHLGGPAQDGRYPVTVTATDPLGRAASSTFSWSVAASGPVVQNDTATTPEATPVTIAVLANDSDPAGLPLSVSAASADHGAVAINPDGTIVFTPEAGYRGPAIVTYTATDSAGNMGSGTATVTVTATDHAPVARPIPAAYAQDSQPGIAMPVAGYFADPDGDALRYAATGLPAGLTLDPATGLISGSIDHGASAVGGGVYHIVVTATDPSGAQAASGFDWTIVNPAPTAHNDSAVVAQDMPGVIAVLGNDVDPDGDALSVTAAQAVHGAVAINPDGTLSYTPDAGFVGQDVIDYAITDGQGGASSAVVTVTVMPSDRHVVANSDAATTRAGEPVVLDVLANDVDSRGDPLAVVAAAASHGAVAINPDGTLRYTPDAGYSGADTIAYTVSDGAGGVASTTVAVTIIPDRVPDAAPDTATTRAGAPVSIAVLANDSDADGDPLTVTAAGAQHGRVTIAPDGALVYTPDAGFGGTDTIRYAIADGHGGTAQSTVAVAVLADHAPTIDPRPAIDTVGGRPVTVAGLAAAHDADGDPLTITQASAAAGTVAINPDGTLTYTPARGFVGVTSLSYTVDDGHGGTATATLLVRVAAPQGRGDTQQALAIGRGISPAWESPPGADGRIDDAGIGFGAAGSAAIGSYGLGFDPARPIELTDGIIRSPFPTLSAVNAARSLNGTTDLSGATPIADAIEGVATLDSIGDGGTAGLGGVAADHDAIYPIGAEVERLGRLADFRDAAARLYDRRWGDLGDFGAHPFSGFSAAADQHCGVMVETLVQGGAIYLDVRDTAPDRQAAIRRVDVTLAGGGTPDWIAVDPRGFAIIEAGAASDELHLVVTVTRTDGTRSSTPIVVQRATGEIELDRHGTPKASAARVPPAGHHPPGRAAPLDATLHTPHAAAHAAAQKLSTIFQ